jgi:transcriptional regulator with XRE-family HTH domain
MDADYEIQGVALAAIAGGVPLLKAFRTHRDLDIEDLAATARIPPEDIEQAEAGGALSFDYLASIAEALDIPVEMLLWHAARSPQGAGSDPAEAAPRLPRISEDAFSGT